MSEDKALLEFHQDSKERFKIYSEILLHWNKTHNLSGIHQAEQIYENILDSIYPLSFIYDFQSCLDVGSGSGFPALPLAICKPDVRFVLLEPRLKRASFLHYVALELGLDKLEVKKCRLQDLNSDEVCDMDLITSRAVMPSENLIEWGKKFLKKNGYYLFYKGSHLSKETAYEANECFSRGNRVYFYRKDKR